MELLSHPLQLPDRLWAVDGCNGTGQQAASQIEETQVPEDFLPRGEGRMALGVRLRLSDFGRRVNG